MSWLLVLLAATAEPAVTLVTYECTESLNRSIHDELEAAGLPTLAPEQGTPMVAHVVARCEGSSVVARVEDKVTAKIVERKLEIAPGPRGEVLLALRVVELLHASLAETRFASVALVPVRVERFLAEREPPARGAWEFGISGGFTYAPGGFEAEPSISAEVARVVSSWPSWRVELGGLIAATVKATVLQSSAGAADVGLIEPRALLAIAYETSGWTARARLSLGVLLVWAVGRANLPWGAATGLTGTFEAALGVSVSRELTQWLGLRLGVDLAATPIPVQVVLPDSVARIGAPVLTLQLGLVFR